MRILPYGYSSANYTFDYTKYFLVTVSDLVLLFDLQEIGECTK